MLTAKGVAGPAGTDGGRDALASLGVTRDVPVLGVFLLAVAIPALLRTLVWVARSRQDGLVMLWPEKLGAFAASVGIVWLILLGTGAAFGFAFAVGTFIAAVLQAAALGNWGNGSAVLFTSMTLGCVGGGTAGYYLIKTLWPIKD